MGLALCLLLSITTKVSGKPNPRHLLIETEKQAKAKYNDDYQNIQTMTGNDIRGGSVSQSQNNGWGGIWGGGSGNSQSMTDNIIRGGNVRQSQNGWGSGNTQSMGGNIIHGASVSQTQGSANFGLLLLGQKVLLTF